ncbi:MAG: hypothetical protein IJH31_05050 [Erysipelotrichaceae bacterium]|nr:hypothetical protein [Erysipelotrichaceae bacterium]
MKKETSMLSSYIGIVCGAILIISGLVILFRASSISSNGRLLGEYYYATQYISDIVSRCGLLVLGTGIVIICVFINQKNIIKQNDEIFYYATIMERNIRKIEDKITEKEKIKN